MPAQGSRGRPSTRSPMMLRCTSLVPPAIVRLRLKRKPRLQACRLAVGDRAVRADQREPDLLHVLVVLHAEQLAHRRLRTARVGAGQRGEREPEAEHRERVAACRRARRPRRGRAASPACPRSRTASRIRSTPCPNVMPLPMNTRSFASVVRAARQPSCSGADEAVVGDEHVVEEHLVEHRLAGQLAQRPDVDARGLHVEHEARDAVVLGRVGVRAGEQDAPVGLLGHRGPHLLAVEDPAALDACRPGRQRRRGRSPRRAR